MLQKGVVYDSVNKISCNYKHVNELWLVSTMPKKLLS